MPSVITFFTTPPSFVRFIDSSSFARKKKEREKEKRISGRKMKKKAEMEVNDTR